MFCLFPYSVVGGVPQKGTHFEDIAIHCSISTSCFLRCNQIGDSQHSPPPPKQTTKTPPRDDFMPRPLQTHAHTNTHSSNYPQQSLQSKQAAPLQLCLSGAPHNSTNWGGTGPPPYQSIHQFQRLHQQMSTAQVCVFRLAFSTGGAEAREAVVGQRRGDQTAVAVVFAAPLLLQLRPCLLRIEAVEQKKHQKKTSDRCEK